MKEDLIMKFRNVSKKELFWLLLSVIILGFCLSFLDKTSGEIIKDIPELEKY